MAESMQVEMEQTETHELIEKKRMPWLRLALMVVLVIVLDQFTNALHAEAPSR